MPLTFMGLRVVPGRAAQNAQNKTQQSSVNAVMTWVAQAEANPAVIALPFPGLSIDGWQFLIDPVANQGSFTFGQVKAVRVTRRQGQPFSDNAGNFFEGGPLFLYSQSSGELIAIGQNALVAGDLYVTGTIPYRYDNFISPINCVSKIQVFMEKATSSIVAVDNTNYVISLYNYDVNAVDVR